MAYLKVRIRNRKQFVEAQEKAFDLGFSFDGTKALYESEKLPKNIVLFFRSRLMLCDFWGKYPHNDKTPLFPFPQVNFSTFKKYGLEASKFYKRIAIEGSGRSVIAEKGSSSTKFNTVKQAVDWLKGNGYPKAYRGRVYGALSRGSETYGHKWRYEKKL